MKKLIAIFLALVVSFAGAEDQTTQNLITSGTSHTWTGVTDGSMAMICPTDGGACSGGPGPLYDPSTNTIHFSYGQGNVSQTFAINQALQNAGAGIQITGYNYTWDIRNMNGDNRQPGTDTISINVITTDGQGLVRRTDSWSYNNKFDWTTFSGTVNYTNPGPVSEFGSLTVRFTGSDSGFWGGYFGPQVKDVGLRMNYSVVDQCATNPLSSPSCAGYEAAYQTQQCSINSLYSPSCPGYQQAYLTQQCSINSLYDPSCPGYAAAYYSHQCSMNALYDKGCPGYAEAFFNEQCKKDSLYSNKCEGYSTAYAIAYIIPLENSSLINQSLASTAAADPSKQATQVVKDDTINTAITPTQSTSTTSPTSVTSVVRDPNPETRTPPKEEKKVEKVSNPETRELPKEEKKEVQSPKKTAENKRRAEEAIKAAAKAKTPNEVLAAQPAIVAGMGMLPGFETYQNNNILDAQFYKSKDIYSNQKTVDNRNAQRFLSGASELRHQMMVEQQYQLGEK
jgi:hypothetical protein